MGVLVLVIEVTNMIYTIIETNKENYVVGVNVQHDLEKAWQVFNNRCPQNGKLTLADETVNGIYKYKILAVK